MKKIRLRSKAELSKLRTHIVELKTASWLDSGRDWWLGTYFIVQTF